MILRQDVGCIILDLTSYRSTAAITSSSCTSEVSPTNDKDAEPNKQFLFCIDLNKIFLDLIKLRIKHREAWHNNFTTCGSLAVNYALD